MALLPRRDKPRGKALPSFRVRPTSGIVSAGPQKPVAAASLSAAVARYGMLPRGALRHVAPPLSVDIGDAAFDGPAPPTSGVAPLEMPTILKQICQDFKTWAETNHEDEKRDRVKFWALRIPAILVTSAASFLAVFRVEFVDALFAFVGAVCIALDSIIKPGKLRSVHWQAVCDLRQIQHEIRFAWNQRYLTMGEKPSREELNNLTAEIIEFARREHTRVHEYLATAEVAI